MLFRPRRASGLKGDAVASFHIKQARLARVSTCRQQLVRPSLTSSLTEAPTQCQVLGLFWGLH